MNGKNSKSSLFIITSVIYFDSSPLSYSAERSIFTPEQRSVQTLETIRSIRKFSKNSKIVLIESGQNSSIDKKLVESVDQFIYTGKNIFVRKFTDGPKKGLGESISLIIGLKRVVINRFKYIYKISGRYKLNKNFDESTFNHKRDFTFKKYDSPTQVSTRLYGLSPRAFVKWRKILIHCLPLLFIGKSIEQTLYEKVKKLNTSYVKNLGLTGFIGPDGSKLSE